MEDEMEMPFADAEFPENEELSEIQDSSAVGESSTSSLSDTADDSHADDDQPALRPRSNRKKKAREELTYDELVETL